MITGILFYFIFVFFTEKILGIVGLCLVSELCSNLDAIMKTGFQEAIVENFHAVCFWYVRILSRQCLTETNAFGAQLLFAIRVWRVLLPFFERRNGGNIMRFVFYFEKFGLFFFFSLKIDN